MHGDRSVLLCVVCFISGLVPHTNMNKNKKWVTFTFISPHIRKITNLFRNTNIKIAFRCHNTIGSLIKPPKDHNIPPHNKWGIYQLTCNLSYVGQTSWNLKICIQEHIRYTRRNSPQSVFAQHILQNQQGYGQMSSINDLAKNLSVAQPCSFLTNNTTSKPST